MLYLPIQNCRLKYYVKNSSWISLTDYNPGDEIVFRASDGPFPGVYAELQGEEGNPIVISSEGVPVIQAGIEFNNCQNIKASGFAINGGVGWENNNGVAINIFGRSKNIELFVFSITLLYISLIPKRASESMIPFLPRLVS